MVKLTILDRKKLITLLAAILFLCTNLVYAKSKRKYRNPEDLNFATEYKSLTINKAKNELEIIENELFDNQNLHHEMIISRSDGGIYYNYHFYKVDEDNICLGIRACNNLQEEAVLYVNTYKECGTKCKIYLSKPEDKQIFYLWEPSKEVITDKSKGKIVIKTSTETYILFVRIGVTELELFAEGFPKIKTIKGLENFPNLVNLSFVGFDY